MRRYTINFPNPTGFKTNQTPFAQHAQISLFRLISALQVQRLIPGTLPQPLQGNRQWQGQQLRQNGVLPRVDLSFIQQLPDSALKQQDGNNPIHAVVQTVDHHPHPFQMESDKTKVRGDFGLVAVPCRVSSRAASVGDVQDNLAAGVAALTDGVGLAGL
ncbi:MAG: hypothetical protein P9E88_13930, partial [Candidatus Competibacter sp.]|nr:hypothetical protein [Candidatus Competibacter sp.]